MIFIALATFLVGAVAATVIGSTTEADAVPTKLYIMIHQTASYFLLLPLSMPMSIAYISSNM